MAVGKEYSIFEIDGSHLAALSAIVSSDRIILRRWLVAQRPSEVRGDDASAIGQWVGAEFQKAQLYTGRVILAASRGDVVLKQLTLPAGASREVSGSGTRSGKGGGLLEQEVASIVKLQMARQLTMQGDGTAIDYLSPQLNSPSGAGALGTGASAGTGASPGAQAVPSGLMTVMAGAMPADRVAWSRGVASNAGLKLNRIGLRCFGIAALVAEISQRKNGTVLAIAMGSGTTEFVLVEDGQLTFARAVDLERPSSEIDWDGYAEKIAVEAKRTWMSYRAGMSAAGAEMVAVVGQGQLAQLVGQACAASLGCTSIAVGLPGFVQIPDDMPEAAQAMLAPLVGLLTETVLGRKSFDFASPRQLPDTKAKQRQLVLAGALGVILLAGVGYIAADQKLSGLRADLVVAQAKENELRQELEQHLVRHARVNHFDQWSLAKVDFLAHLKRLHEVLPDPTSGVVTDFNARLASLPVYTAGSGRYPAGSWGNLNEVLVNLSGKVESRRVASELREKLLGDGVYTVESRGADLPDQFSYQLTSTRLNPYEAPRGSKSQATKSSPDKASPDKASSETTSPNPTSSNPAAAESKDAPPAANPAPANSGGGVP